MSEHSRRNRVRFERLETRELMTGDTNLDGQTDSLDIDHICQLIDEQVFQASADLDENGVIDNRDFEILVNDILSTRPGDANLDGVFDESDLIAVFTEGKFEDGISKNAGWASGDWTCDMEFTTSDLVHAMTFGSFLRSKPEVIMVVLDDEDILLYDGNTGEFFDVLLDEKYARGLALGPNGDVFTTITESDGNGRVTTLMRYDLDGELIATSAPFLGADLPKLQIGPDGALYVASFVEPRVDRYDIQDGKLEFDGTILRDDFGRLSGTKGLAFGPDGNIYLSSRNTGEVLRYDLSTGEFIDVFASLKERGGRPQGLTFGPDGFLYVADDTTDTIQKFHGETGEYSGIFASTYDAASGMTPVFGPDGNLYVSGSFLADSIQRFDGVTGELIDVFVSNTNDWLDYPTDFVFFRRPD